tara:strand:- start:181 stop:600 length:420 start_codon:yes stop_codon:yes gene_type:complete
MKFLARKHHGKLEAIDDAGEEALRHIKGDVMVEVKQPRNIQHHRLYFALLGKVFTNQDHYKTLEELGAALKVACGICQTFTLKNGQKVYIPGSISFAKMQQPEFNEFYSNAIDVVCKHFLPGVESADLRNEIQEIVGVA